MLKFKQFFPLQNIEFSAFPLGDILYYVKKLSRFNHKRGFINDTPGVVQIQINSLCNMQCIMCSYSITSKKLAQGSMEADQVYTLIDELATFTKPFTFVPMLQNEPLVDKRLHDVIGYFKRKSLKNGYVQITTNGTLLTKEAIYRIIDSGLDRIIISLNTMDKEEYRLMHNLDKLDSVIENIYYLIEKGDGNIQIIISFVRTSINNGNIGKYMEFFRKRGVFVKSIDACSRPEILDRFNDIHVGFRRKGELLRKINRRFGCFFPFINATILFNGDMILCCNDWDRSLVLGNVFTNGGIKAVWNGEKYNAIRAILTSGKYYNLDVCKTCSLVI